MRMSCKLVLAAAASLVATGAGAAKYQIAGLATKQMTYTTDAAVAAARTTGFSGVGTIFVNTVSTGPNSGFLCTASLINSYTILSAAHCIYDHDEATGALDPVTSIRFYLPSFGSRATGDVFTATSFAYNPGYDTADHLGDIGSGYDVSVITLGGMAVGRDIYSLYTGGDPLGVFTEVGTGTVGGPSGTNNGISDYQKRVGTNIYELYGDDLFSDVSHGVVLADFDDGTAAHDVFGRNLAPFGAPELNQTGIEGESSSSPGDSGGPEFNAAGQIVSVTSFGVTGGIFDGFCGGTSTDPYNSRRTTAVSALSGCTNSSVGEIMGNTLVSYNLDFINGYLDTHPFLSAVPEPASWAMMIAGIGLAGGTLRRRRVRFATATA